MKLFFIFFILSLNVYSSEVSVEKAKLVEEQGLYLALINHVSKNLSTDSNFNNYFEIMLTGILGNSYYLTAVPSFSWAWDEPRDIRLNDLPITLSYGVVGGNSLSNLTQNENNFGYSFTILFPTSTYSRSNGLILTSIGSVKYTFVFNRRKTNITISPSFSYNFRKNTTSSPSADSYETLIDYDASKVFEYDGRYFEKLNPHMHFSVSSSLTLVHRFFDMTYFISWASINLDRYYDSSFNYNGQNIVIGASNYSYGLSFGGKIFLPLYEMLWVDFSTSLFTSSIYELSADDVTF
jgi:hypothetical protein